MGFWYRNASIGPNSLCQTSSGTLPRFDRPTGADGPDGSINQSATRAPPFDLTGAPYTCKSGAGRALVQLRRQEADDQRLDLHRRQRDELRRNDATYVGQGALILSGTFSMDNHDKLCVKLTDGGDCDTAAPWDPNVSGMFIFAAGDFARSCRRQRNAGNGIDIKKGQYQGGLFAANKISATVTGTVVQGPMVSAYSDVATGQGGELELPVDLVPDVGLERIHRAAPSAETARPPQLRWRLRCARTNRAGRLAGRKESHGVDPATACGRRPGRERRPPQGRPSAGRPLRRRARAAAGLLAPRHARARGRREPGRRLLTLAARGCSSAPASSTPPTSRSGLPRFRVNAFRQRGDVSLAFRVIPRDGARLREPPPAARRRDAVRGAPRADPRHGRHRRRQDDDARRDDRPHQPDAPAAHRHDRGPDRVPSRRRELHRQPARGRDRHRVVRRGAAGARCVRTRT